jgi:hypothetical protein
MSKVEFEATTPAFERPKTITSLDSAAALSTRTVYYLFTLPVHYLQCPTIQFPELPQSVAGVLSQANSHTQARSDMFQLAFT